MNSSEDVNWVVVHEITDLEETSLCQNLFLASPRKWVHDIPKSVVDHVVAGLDEVHTNRVELAMYVVRMPTITQGSRTLCQADFFICHMGNAFSMNGEPSSILALLATFTSTMRNVNWLIASDVERHVMLTTVTVCCISRAYTASR